MSETAPVLGGVYGVLSELWCNPEDVDREAVERDARAAVAALDGIEPEGSALLSQFLSARATEDGYVEMFELDPRCPLYLGSHVFAEPKSCAQAGVSDRNGYMIELVGIYRHFGLSPNGRELPDYLPLMVELLALTAEKRDPVRTKLMREYILPLLPPLRERLSGLSSPYLHLLDALERVMKLDLQTETAGAEP